MSAIARALPVKSGDIRTSLGSRHSVIGRQLSNFEIAHHVHNRTDTRP
jgi:hypothetical protein